MDRQTQERRNQILAWLPDKGPGVTALKLTGALDKEGYTVTKKTVQRDLDFLSTRYPLVCNDKSEPYGWRWADAKAKSAARHGMALSEAVSLTLIAKELRRALPRSLLEVMEPQLAEAEARMRDEAQLTGAAGWKGKLESVPRYLEMVPPKVNAEVLAVVEEAVLAERQIDLTYKSLEAPAAKERRLEPLGILQRGAITYLVARTPGAADPFMYAIHRATRAKMTEARVRRGDFKLHDFIKAQRHVVGPNVEIALKARIDSSLIKILRETPLAPDMSVEPDGDWFLIEANVLHNTALEQWVLGHGRAVEVLAPAVLRRAIHEHVRALAKIYG